MHYHRRPAFALLLYIFQPYLKAISEMRLTQPLSVSFHHLNEWMKEVVQSCLGLWPCQDYFLRLSVRGYTDILVETAFKWAEFGNPFFRGLPAPPSSLLVSTICPLKPPSGRLLWASLSSKHTWEGCRRPDQLSWWQQEENPCASQGSWVYCVWANGCCKTSCFWATVWWQQRQIFHSILIFFLTY